MFRLIVKRTGVAYAALGIVLLLAAGCTNPQTPAPEPAASAHNAPEYYEHRITYSGETLAIIAKHYTGRSQSWNEILAANPGLRPERMRIGQVVRIPRSMLVTEAPLPKHMVKVGAVKTEQLPVTIETPGEPPTVARPEGAESLNGRIEETNVGVGVGVGEVPAVQPTSNPVTPVGAVVTTEPPAEAAKPAPDPADAEREKLLDELLKQ